MSCAALLLAVAVSPQDVEAPSYCSWTAEAVLERTPDGGTPPSGAVTWTSDAEGVLSVWTEPSDDDLVLRVYSGSGELLLEDDDSGGGTVPFGRILVVDGSEPRVVVSSKDPGATGVRTVRFGLSEDVAGDRRGANVALSERARALVAARDGSTGADLGPDAAQLAAEILAVPLHERDFDWVVAADELADVAEGRIPDQDYFELAAAAEAAISTLAPATRAQVWIVRSSLGRAASRLGRQAIALEMLGAAYEGVRVARPLDDAWHGFIRNHYAVACIDASRPDLALPVFQIDLEVDTARCGPDSTEALATKVNVAVALAGVGRLEESERCAAEVVAALERSDEPDERTLNVARECRASTLQALGRYGEALVEMDAVLDAARRSEGSDSMHVATLLRNRSIVLDDLGRIDEAIESAREGLRTVAVVAPPGHPEIAIHRFGVARLLVHAGRTADALPMLEEARVELLRALPPTHLRLIECTRTQALALRRVGRVDEGDAMLRDLLEELERAGLGDSRTALQTRISLENMADCYADPVGGVERWERLLEEARRLDRAGNGEVLTALDWLAEAQRILGDTQAALATTRERLAVLLVEFDEDHPSVLDCRSDEAILLAQLGRGAESHAQLEEILERAEAALPPDHALFEKLWARFGASCTDEGEPERAQPYLEAVYERVRARDGAESRSALLARRQLAICLERQGKWEEARTEHRAILEAVGRTDDPGSMRAMTSYDDLVGVDVATGDTEALTSDAVELASLLLGALDRVRGGAPNELFRALAEYESEVMSLVGAARRTRDATLDALIFQYVETARDVAAGAGGGRYRHDPELAGLVERSTNARRRLADAIAESGDGASAEAGAAVAKLARERDRVDRELRSRLVARGELGGPIEASAVSAALPEGSAAVTFRIARHLDHDDAEDWLVHRAPVVLAFVVESGEPLRRVELGLAADLDDLVEAWRAALGKPVERGLDVDEDSDDAERTAGAALRAAFLDPVLALLGEDVERVHVCLDGALHLVPLDALPLGEGLLGDRYEIVDMVSLAQLLVDAPRPDGEPALLAVGGANYDADVEGDGSDDGEGVRVGTTGVRGAVVGALPALLQTRFEARSVADLFEERFDTKGVLLSRDAATVEAFARSVGDARYVHVATHGWFATEDVASLVDGDDLTTADRARASGEEIARGLAPLALCGLAFAGANRGVDANGRAIGVLSAELLSGLDLSRCELAVLSACETNVGIRRAGSGIQSLRSALHAAGARTTITSLWKVDDAATRMLFELFYTHLWIDGMGKAEALWRAKEEVRDSGAPTRDWAGWVLTGQPD
ncbi:MAG: CHAT domain-containing tetratricopeptide repeat protein [Planctomycetota bacterium]